jgi:hypothetical protein
MNRLLIVLAVSLFALPARAATTVCVDVTVKSWSKDGVVGKKLQSSSEKLAPGAPAAAPGAPAPANAPLVPEETTEQSTLEPAQEGATTAPAGSAVAPVTTLDSPQSTPSSTSGALEEYYRLRAARRAEAENLRTPPDRYDVDPARYLERMLEYEVTHDVGFSAVEKGCKERITVELYALTEGWTVFARYTQNAREEKVDQVELDEFVELAQRLAAALLHDRPITDTITRDNVLRADSEIGLRNIKGRGHLLFGMGTAFRAGIFQTTQGDAVPVADQLRLFTPFDVALGYRTKFQAFGLDAFARMNLGTETMAVGRNNLGGHVDYAGSGALGLHFLRYLDAPGVNSLYLGGGASLELTLFDVIRPVEQRDMDKRSTLVGGGLNLDLLVGYEFLRAGAVHFFVQLEAQAPTYIFNTSNDFGHVRSYVPGGLAQVGVIL